MSKHTPGPWTPVHSGPFCWDIYGLGERWLAQTDRLFDDGSEHAPEECEANARLIAAAPDLLEALEMVRAAEADCHSDGLGTLPAIVRAKIDRAIAKAKG